MMRHKIAVVAVVAVAALASGAWFLQRETEPVGSVYQQARLFDDVLAHVSDYYVDSLDERRLYQMAIDGLLDQLGDPYSVYLKPEDFRGLTEATTGNYTGLGIQIDVRDGWITVVGALPDTPAERAGIQTADRIVALDGRPTEGWKQDQAVKELRGPAGTVAELAIRRVGVDQPITFKITRATIHIRSVQIAIMLDQHVGYISLNPVNETSAQDVTLAVDSLLKLGMKSLVFDLRGNPGGLLDQGVAVSDLFLDPGKEIVATRGRAPGSSREFRDSKAQRWAGLPIVVLVNGGSASAAEIIAGALQDHDRAVLIGTPTFGKGLVQSFWRLTPESGLKLTTARWYTPSGRTIQRVTRTEAEQEAQVLAAQRGQDTVKVDSMPVFHTDGGRIVYGGGGIRPDMFVAPDTFTAAERAFTRGLGNKIPVFRDALTSYALELKEGRRLPAPNFTVTDGMVDEVLRRIRAKGAVVPDSIVAGARSLIAQELTYEAARYAFGRPAEFRRRMADDRQVQRALTLAQRAKSPQDLLAQVVTPAPVRNQ
ncbi:MAG TPA: S41 family peptidase [Gemmatimonadales bacterium]|jgi:carboxyl-terminal processing protease|nr:S41 family peptidase [Gemmatimonadales bacterium]